MSKKLVAYFSASGKTAKVAENLAKAAKADLFEIKPAAPYTRDDLNWMNKQSRSSVEMRDKSSRPALADTDADIAAYDTIFIGFPIWWYTAPTIIRTFIEAYDFNGKIVVFFATSGGTDVMKATTDLMEVLNGKGKVRGGIVMGRPGLTDQMLEGWVQSLQLP